LMSKINLDELQEMLKAGRTQTECAKHFEVSDAAICKAVKRIRATVLPASMEKLTDKEKVFVLNLAEGKSKTDAACAAYDCVNRDVAKTMGCRLAKDPDVETALTDLMAQEGISKRQRIRRLKDLISSSDLSAVSKGLDMSWKLDGSYAPEKIDVAGQIASVHALVAEIKNLDAQRKLTAPDEPEV